MGVRQTYSCCNHIHCNSILISKFCVGLFSNACRLQFFQPTVLHKLWLLLFLCSAQKEEELANLVLVLDMFLSLLS